MPKKTIYLRPGRMTAAQYRAVRIRAKLTQVELASRLGITEQTVKNREGTRHPVSREAELALLCVTLATAPGGTGDQRTSHG